MLTLDQRPPAFRGAPTWSLNSRRSRSSSAKQFASLPSRRSARTSWNGTKREIFPLDAIKQAGQLGLLGAIFPEDLGGAGLGYVEYSIIIEELARVDPSVGLIVAAHNSLCTNHIYLAGNDEQRRKYIPKLATGEWIGCWSLTETESGPTPRVRAPKP